MFTPISAKLSKNIEHNEKKIAYEINREEDNDDIMEHMNFGTFNEQHNAQDNDDDNNEEIRQLPIDVIENNKGLQIICPLPAVSISDISLSIEDDTLSIEADMTHPLIDEETNKKINYHIKEVFWGKYRRDIVLPTYVQKNNIKARYIDNILIIDIPRQIKGKSKKFIKINMN